QGGTASWCEGHVGTGTGRSYARSHDSNGDRPPPWASILDGEPSGIAVGRYRDLHWNKNEWVWWGPRKLDNSAFGRCGAAQGDRTVCSHSADWRNGYSKRLNREGTRRWCYALIKVLPRVTHDTRLQRCILSWSENGRAAD